MTVAKSRRLEHGDATMPAPTSNKERKRQEEKPQNLILQACLNSSPRVGQKGYDTPSGSSADKVSQALRKQRSSESDTESPEFLRRRRTLGAVSRGPSILAEIRSQKEREKEREVEKGEKEEEGKERSAARKLFTDAEKLKSELKEVKLSEKESPRALVSNSGAGQPTSASNRTGRIKSVDKPIKMLEIASEPEASAGSSPPPSTAPRTERPHRAKSVEKPVKTLGIASEQRQGISTESKPPAWVAIAQVYLMLQVQHYVLYIPATLHMHSVHHTTIPLCICTLYTTPHMLCILLYIYYVHIACIPLYIMYTTLHPTTGQAQEGQCSVHWLGVQHSATHREGQEGQRSVRWSGIPDDQHSATHREGGNVSAVP